MQQQSDESPFIDYEKRIRSVAAADLKLRFLISDDIAFAEKAIKAMMQCPSLMEGFEGHIGRIKSAVESGVDLIQIREVRESELPTSDTSGLRLFAEPVGVLADFVAAMRSDGRAIDALAGSAGGDAT